MDLTIYLAGPITGKSSDEVFSHFDNLSETLRDEGFRVLHPMIGKDSLRNESSFKSNGYTQHPVTTDNAIFSRDMWCVEQADILLVDLSSAKEKSIGSIMEIAWGALLKKQIVLVMPKGNVHTHVFTLQASTIIYENLDDAIEYVCEYV